MLNISIQYCNKIIHTILSEQSEEQSSTKRTNVDFVSRKLSHNKMDHDIKALEQKSLHLEGINPDI